MTTSILLGVALLAAISLMSPVLAGAAMALSSVSVVLNAGRIRRVFLFRME